MWGQASNRGTVLSTQNLRTMTSVCYKKRNYGKLKMVGIFRHLRWSSGVRVPVAYIILSTILNLVAYMGGQQRETAGSVQDWEER